METAVQTLTAESDTGDRVESVVTVTRALPPESTAEPEAPSRSVTLVVRSAGPSTEPSTEPGTDPEPGDELSAEPTTSSRVDAPADTDSADVSSERTEP